MVRWRVVCLAASAAVLCALRVGSQERPDPARIMAAQRQAMAKLSFMDGEWRGTAWTLLPTGEKHTLTQTERAGQFLGGTLRMVEGRGYEPDGRVGFNAFGVLSYDPNQQTYSLRAYTEGMSGDFPVTLTADGFTWERSVGPAKIRYTTVIKNGEWNEHGELVRPDGRTLRVLEMSLKRIGDTGWPADGAVKPK